jgi:hypothetical protein
MTTTHTFRDSLDNIQNDTDPVSSQMDSSAYAWASTSGLVVVHAVAEYFDHTTAVERELIGRHDLLIRLSPSDTRTLIAELQESLKSIYEWAGN